MRRLWLMAIAVSFLATPVYGQDDQKAEEEKLLPGDEGYPTRQTAPIEFAEKETKSGIFVGGGLGFGQAKSTEEDSSAGLTFLGNLELGYQMKRGPWNRIEASLQLLSGKASFRFNDEFGTADMPIGFGLLARFGYGYSIGSKFTGVFKVGVGPVQARFEATPEGVKVESKEALTGLAGQIGWIAVMPMGDSLDITGGLTWTHMQFDVGELKVGDTTVDIDRSILLNIPQVELGLRLRI